MIKNKINSLQLNNTNSKAIIYDKTVLPNGLRILTEQVPVVESFALGIFFNSGSRDDFEGKNGLAHFLEHAAFRHTKTRTSKQLASQFESVGAYTNAYTTKEATGFYVRALNEHFEKTLELLADLTYNTVFVDKDIEKERSIIIEEIKTYEDDPEELIMDYGEKLIFADNPLEKPIVGVADTVNKISCDDLSAFQKKYYRPDNTVVSFAGNIEHGKVAKLVEKYLGSYNVDKTELNRTVPEYKNPQFSDTEQDFSQSHILVCRKIPGLNDPDRFPLAALNVILGDGMSSRLYQELREKRGLAYSIYSSLQQLTDCGGFYVYTGLEGSQLEKTQTLIFNEFGKFLDKNVTPSELKRAKEQLKANTIMALESLSTRMQNLAKGEFAFNRYESIEDTINSIDELTQEDIKKVSEKYLQKKDWSTVIFRENEDEDEDEE